MQEEQAFTILVVDDEPPICEILTRIAQKTFPEAKFSNTRSVQETLDYLDHQPDNPPRLILLDIDLRQTQNGLDLLPELRTRFAGQVPVIMLSMITEDDTIDQAYSQGAVAYTQKPEDMEGWRQYVQILKSYWYNSVKLPNKESTEE